MDFFEKQDRARAKTKLLVLYYFLAIFFIVVSVYFLVFFSFTQTFGDQVQNTKIVHVQGLSSNPARYVSASLWQPQLFCLVAGIILLIVLSGSFYKISQLSSGGKVVALSLGGRLVLNDEGDLQLKKLLNVVDEMAIASGTPVPPVYLMENEAGINAFAAGFSQHDAVIGVTRGAVEQLDRDELQGVIAHEFSHILNGDMRLNIRLMGIVHGILLIATTGYWLLRSTGSRHRRSKKDNGGGIALFGLGLMAIGYIGVFFGKLIKSAVSREREYLADASAVQFTRNPIGIANALKKIGGFPVGSRLESAKAEEASHMFFSNGIKSFFNFSSLMATHPPLPERIMLLDPSFKGDYSQLQKISKTKVSESELHAGISSFASGAAVGVGEVSAEHLDYAKTLLASLPGSLVKKAREIYGARAVIYALLIDRNEEVQDRQLTALSQQADKTVFQETLRIYREVSSLDRKNHFPLVELCLPALSYLSTSQYEIFKKCIDSLIQADGRISLFEYSISKLIFKHLDIATGLKSADAKLRNADFQNDLEIVLSALAYVGQADAESAFNEASRVFESKLNLVPKASCKIESFDLALDNLMYLEMKFKKKIIEACRICVSHDGEILTREAELFRLVADILDCPIPPIID